MNGALTVAIFVAILLVLIGGVRYEAWYERQHLRRALGKVTEVVVTIRVDTRAFREAMARAAIEVAKLGEAIRGIEVCNEPNVGAFNANDPEQKPGVAAAAADQVEHYPETPGAP